MLVKRLPYLRHLAIDQNEAISIDAERDFALLDKLALNLWITFFTKDEVGQDYLASMYRQSVEFVESEHDVRLKLSNTEVSKWIHSLNK
jgi:hypothetical protein